MPRTERSYVIYVDSRDGGDKVTVTPGKTGTEPLVVDGNWFDALRAIREDS